MRTLRCLIALALAVGLLLTAAGCPDADPVPPPNDLLALRPPPPILDPRPEPPKLLLPAGFVYRDTHGAKRFRVALGPRDPQAPLVDQRLADKVFIPLGINYAWPSIPAGALEFKVTLPELTRNGVNLIRLWQSTWGFDLGGWNEEGKLDGPGLQALDEVFAEAEKNNVKILLVYDNHFDLLNNQNKHGLFKASGQPDAVCDTIVDYCQLPAARKIHAARLKALLARYGPSPALFGIEFCNEIDLILPVGPLDFRGVKPLESWARFMAEIVWAERKAGNLNAWHPVGISTVGARSLNLYADPRFDWVSVHLYIPEGLALRNDEQFNETALVGLTSLYYEFSHWPYATRPRLRLPHRPWIMEYGFSSPDHIARRNFNDPTGRHLRHALWAALAAGGEGAPMPWWWDTYILPNKLYRLYRPLSAAIHGLPWDTVPTRMIDTAAAVSAAQPAQQPPLPARDHRCRIFATVWSDTAFAYLARDEAAWSKKDAASAPSGRAELQLGDFSPGRYAVEWIDPATGHAAAPHQIVDHPGGRLQLPTPFFADDLAVVIHREPGR